MLNSMRMGLHLKPVLISQQLLNVLTGSIHTEKRESTEGFVDAFVFNCTAKGECDPFWIYECPEMGTQSIAVFLTPGRWMR